MFLEIRSPVSGSACTCSSFEGPLSTSGSCNLERTTDSVEVPNTGLVCFVKGFGGGGGGLNAT